MLTEVYHPKLRDISENSSFFTQNSAKITKNTLKNDHELEISTKKLILNDIFLALIEL
jgi:hypothetical protein